jgi:hypothetical protein
MPGYRFILQWLAALGRAHLHDALEKIAVAGREQIRRDGRFVRVNVVAHAVHPDIIQLCV